MTAGTYSGEKPLKGDLGGKNSQPNAIFKLVIDALHHINYSVLATCSELEGMGQ